MITVVIPFRGGCPHRERALRWVLARYAEVHRDWKVVVADAPPGPWVKAWAVMPAVATAESGPVLVADADVWCEGIQEAVDAVVGGAEWAIPHSVVRRLSQEGTDQLLAAESEPELEVRPYLGVMGGGLLVADAETLLEVPLDPRFEGWGQEDLSHAVALRCLKGPAGLGNGELLHLWHPPQPRLSRRWGSLESRRLHHRYKDCRRDPEGMRRLTGEARVALATADQVVLDRVPRSVGVD